MKERRAKYTLRTRRSSQILSAKTLSEKNSRPKRKQLKSKELSSSRLKDSVFLSLDSISSTNHSSESTLTDKPDRKNSLRPYKRINYSELETLDNGNDSKKESVKSTNKDNVLTMSKGKSKYMLRKIGRSDLSFSEHTPSKKGSAPKNLNKRKQWKATNETQSDNRRKKSVEFDTLLGSDICPPDLRHKPMLTRKSEKLEGLRRSGRLAVSFSEHTPSKKGSATKNLNKWKQWKATTKTQSDNRRKKSVEFDTLLGSDICPPDLRHKPMLTRKSEKRKISSCSDSLSERRASLRSNKKACYTPKKGRSVLKSTPSPTTFYVRKRKKLKTNEYGNKLISSISHDGGMLLKNFSMNKSNNEESICLDDLLFVRSSHKKESRDIALASGICNAHNSHKKKYRDVTLSSGICSADSSFMSSINTSHQKKKSDNLSLIISVNVSNRRGLFKIPQDIKKTPGKKTLKHRRLVLNELNVRNLGHEDDLLENIKLTPFKNAIDLDNESEASWNIATPKCGFKLSPLLPKRTPVFKDCFSPTELRISRKNAEAYMYRNKRKQSSSPVILPQRQELTKKSPLAILKALSEKEKNIERSLRDEFSSDEEKGDDYCSEEEEEVILNNSVNF